MRLGATRSTLLHGPHPAENERAQDQRKSQGWVFYKVPCKRRGDKIRQRHEAEDKTRPLSKKSGLGRSKKTNISKRR